MAWALHGGSAIAASWAGLMPGFRFSSRAASACAGEKAAQWSGKISRARAAASCRSLTTATCSSLTANVAALIFFRWCGGNLAGTAFTANSHFPPILAPRSLPSAQASRTFRGVTLYRCASPLRLTTWPSAVPEPAIDSYTTRQLNRGGSPGSLPGIASSSARARIVAICKPSRRASSLEVQTSAWAEFRLSICRFSCPMSPDLVTAVAAERTQKVVRFLYFQPGM